ncbi:MULTISPECIES: ABC transporter ATP-binding protein [Clostridium]|uniref:ABC transporter ATP-binding protein n=1 Tax=Clostridium TaxID=1485 RepID=UPI00069E11B9|nr:MULTISPECIES: ABC transporter ATP-binding protein [Clostridium]KOF58031.1 sodium ABC transporter ATP-binding protein [Clostridium sp. DMHC 10]MCD2347143.1 ABC transporter ATP-binding protein [Clostridium guangxiense]
MDNILEVSGLKKDFGSFGLKDVSFSLKKGCITGFIGINGAGKTTTIKSILGLVIKDAGSVKLFGKEIDKNERELKNHIGVVLDDGYFYDDMTLIEMKNIIAPAYSNWDETVFKNYITRFKLPLKQKISTLSKGMRMKYSIALALAHHADLLIMDEPTSGLDPLVRNELMDILLEFMEEDGKSVFFSTHITSDLDKIADVLILIDNGKIVLNEEKDIILDTHGLVKGDKSMINEHTRKLFLKLHETNYNFEGITNRKAVVREQMKNVIIERPTIEDIMLAYIGGDNNAFESC